MTIKDHHKTNFPRPHPTESRQGQLARPGKLLGTAMRLAPLVLGLCFLSGVRAAAAETHSETPEATPRTYARQARGILKAAQRAELAAPISARIIKAPFQSGQRFKQGALLIKFDCNRVEAEKTALEAALNTARFKHDNIKELLFAGAAGELEETLAAAEVKKAEAEINVTKARLKDCAIYAPFNGIVQKRHINVYDTPAINTPLYSIQRDLAPEIKLIAPSSWLAWVKTGSKFRFKIDETGLTYPAQIVRTGASVDPVSQTIELTARFSQSAPGALPGMSGIARFTPHRRK